LPGTYDRNNPVMVAAEVLLGSIEAAAEIGADVDEVLAVTGISREQLQTGDSVLPVHKVLGFLNECARRFGCEHFSLLITKHQPPARFPMVGQLIRFAETLGDAIDDALQYSIPNNEYAFWKLERERGCVILVRQTRVFLDVPQMQMQTLALAVVYKAVNAICGRRLPLVRVEFSHKAPAMVDKLEACFAAPVAFNQPQTAIVFPESVLLTPIPTRDAAVHRMLRAHIENLSRPRGLDESLEVRLRLHIKQTVGSRRCSLEHICRQFGLHPRAMQRALQEAGLSFKALLLDVRMELARDYLRNSSVSVIELSELLGYSNASAFSRAFKQSVGLAPQNWREQA
jgi:AraC-like DNA-binding protein